jgi:hypothetical protein
MRHAQIMEDASFDPATLVEIGTAFDHSWQRSNTNLVGQLPYCARTSGRSHLDCGGGSHCRGQLQSQWESRPLIYQMPSDVGLLRNLNGIVRCMVLFHPLSPVSRAGCALSDASQGSDDRSWARPNSWCRTSLATVASEPMVGGHIGSWDQADAGRHGERSGAFVGFCIRSLASDSDVAMPELIPKLPSGPRRDGPTGGDDPHAQQRLRPAAR